MAVDAITCSSCGAPLTVGQQYCMTCGTRCGPRRPEVDHLMRIAGGRAAPTTPSVPAVAAGWRIPRLVMPSRLLAAALALVFLGTGVALGEIAHRAAIDSLIAAERTPLHVLLAAHPQRKKPSEPVTPSFEPPAEPSTPALPPASTPTNTLPATQPETEPPPSEKPPPPEKLPPVKHVFIVMLASQPYETVFTPISPAPYLAKTLRGKGVVLSRYYAVAHNELANAVALVSGQGPTSETARNCPTYSAITAPRVVKYGQVTGAGCVYPASTKTLPGELEAKHLTWRAYVQGIDEGGTTPPACAHPQLGSADPLGGLEPARGQYTTARNPFVYFASITGSSSCARNDVGMTALQHDLAHPSTTPNLAYIVPDRCENGSSTPCRPGAAAGIQDSEEFLRTFVPQITSSKAFKENGLLVVTVDQAPSSGEFAESAYCCSQPRYPNLGSLSGGGTVGALLISPFIKAGVANEAAQEDFNHYSLLRTIEQFFGLPAIGYAGLPKLPTFPPALFNAKG